MSQSPKGNRPQPAKLFCHSPITTCLGRPPACLRASQPGGATRRRPTPAEDFRYDSPDAKPQLSPRLHDNTSKLQACTKVSGIFRGVAIRACEACRIPEYEYRAPRAPRRHLVLVRVQGTGVRVRRIRGAVRTYCCDFAYTVQATSVDWVPLRKIWDSVGV